MNYEITKDSIIVKWDAEANVSAYLFEIYEDGARTRSEWVYDSSYTLPLTSISGVKKISFRVAAPGTPFSEVTYYNKYNEQPTALNPTD